MEGSGANNSALSFYKTICSCTESDTSNAKESDMDDYISKQEIVSHLLAGWFTYIGYHVRLRAKE